MSKKVLIVEDQEYRHNQWKQKLDSKVELISALSIEEAEEKFVANSDIVAIVMDACVPGDVPTTPPLVRKFRAMFAGPMIAISGDPYYRQELLQAGCDHECEKESVPRKIFEVLDL